MSSDRTTSGRWASCIVGRRRAGSCGSCCRHLRAVRARARHALQLPRGGCHGTPTGSADRRPNPGRSALIKAASTSRAIWRTGFTGAGWPSASPGAASPPTRPQRGIRWQDQGPSPSPAPVPDLYGCGRKVAGLACIQLQGTATRRDRQQGPSHADGIGSRHQPATPSEAGKLAFGRPDVGAQVNQLPAAVATGQETSGRSAGHSLSCLQRKRPPLGAAGNVLICVGNFGCGGRI